MSTVVLPLSKSSLVNLKDFESDLDAVQELLVGSDSELTEVHLPLDEGWLGDIEVVHDVFFTVTLAHAP